MVIGLLQQLRLGIPVLGLNLLKVLILGRQFLPWASRRVVRLIITLCSVDNLPISTTVSTSRLVWVVEGATFGVEGALLIRITWTSIHRTRLILIVALLPLKTLEVRVLSSTYLVLLGVCQYSFL